MSDSRPRRPSADLTREKIVQAAQVVFLKHGFDGAKTSLIAKEAGVHTNLVFHHFKNKASLWLKVKESILTHSADPPCYDLSSAEAYFSSVLDYRFALYQDNPQLVRLMQWQSLTENKEQLMAENFASPFCWQQDLETLQQRGLLTKTVDVSLMLLFLIYSSYAPFMQDIIVLSPDRLAQYKKIVLNF